jgi:cytochrome c oxidase assembly protein Cox11
MTRRQWKNLRVLAVLFCLMGIMVTLVSYSVPLYRLFCAATGFGGTTQRVLADTAKVSDRVVTVRFDTAVSPQLPWRFEPVQREVKVHLGQETLVFFRAKNLSNEPIIGHATFNVTPTKTGLYFNKIQCFCFSDERLNPGESVDMPVDFYVDPALDKDPNARHVDTITLSYTFFRSAAPKDIENLSRFDADAPPDPKRGATLFAERCAACHSLDKNEVGPLLGGVFDRVAGTAAGYNYSPALKAAGIHWTQENLDRWLANPRGFIAGAKMPVRVLAANTRRDIIAYLAAESGKPLASAKRFTTEVVR